MTDETREKAARLHAAYMARRNQYAGQIKDGTNKALADKLAHAAATADLCVTTYVYFAEQMVEMSKRRQDKNAKVDSEARAQVTAALAKIEELKQKVMAEKNPLVREQLFQEADFQLALAKSAEARAGLEIQTSQSSAELSQALFNLNHHSLEQLLTISSAEDVLRVLGAIAKAFAGMIPVVGEAASGMLESWELWKERRPGFETGAETASDIFDKLDAFIYAGYQWCLMAQLAVDTLNDSPEPRLEKAAQAVAERFKTLGWTSPG